MEWHLPHCTPPPLCFSCSFCSHAFAPTLTSFSCARAGRVGQGGQGRGHAHCAGLPRGRARAVGAPLRPD
eukprot:1669596-Pleurochrysis_carterae.AAC.1